MAEGITVKGVTELLRNLGATQKELDDAVAEALYQEGLVLQAESSKEVPVKSGRLRQSSFVTVPKPGPNAETEIGYGTDYALPVHERVEVHHPVGKANFLRDPFNRMRTGYTERLGKRIAARWRAGRKGG